MSNSVAKKLFSGAFWVGFQTVGMKIFSIASQLILAWILIPEDFGKFSLVLSITAFSLILQSFGFTDILISRGKAFSLLYNLSQSICLVLAIGSWILTVLFAIIGGILYEDQELTWLIVIYSFTTPFITMALVPESKVRIDLRFKELSIIQLLQLFFVQLLIVIFAFCGLGVYSFVIAPVPIAIIRFWYLYRITNLPFQFNFTLRRWWHIGINSSWGLVHALCQRIILQADYLLLGLVVTKAILGIYYLAYSLSVQAVGLLTNALTPVLFPVLVTIPKEDTEKLHTILRQMILTFSMLGMPFAIWQCVAAEPLILLFLEDKWKDTIPLVQILSIGIGFHVVGSLWMVSVRIRSAFRQQAMYSIFATLIFLGVLIPSVLLYNSVGTAAGVSIFHIISSPLLLYYANRHFRITFQYIIKSLLTYFGISILIFGFGFYTVHYYNLSIVWSFIINVVVSPLLYILILYTFDKKFKALVLKFKGIIKR